jgi:hypothetical protein
MVGAGHMHVIIAAFAAWLVLRYAVHAGAEGAPRVQLLDGVRVRGGAPVWTGCCWHSPLYRVDRADSPHRLATLFLILLANTTPMDTLLAMGSRSPLPWIGRGPTVVRPRPSRRSF